MELLKARPLKICEKDECRKKIRGKDNKILLILEISLAETFKQGF